MMAGARKGPIRSFDKIEFLTDKFYLEGKAFYKLKLRPELLLEIK